MPRAKRPLAKIDGNANKVVPAKHQKISMRTRLHNANESDENDGGKDDGGKNKKNAKLLEKDDDYDEMLDYRMIDYTTMDTGKLQCLLYDRNMPVRGTRAEMIKTLQQTAPDYESFTTDELTEKLYDRHLHDITGTKRTKIARLLLNDHGDRDSGNSAEGTLYGILSAHDMFPELVKDREKKVLSQFPSWDTKRLQNHLEEKGESTSGSWKTLVKRASKLRKEESDRELEKIAADREVLQAKLEAITGVPATTQRIWDVMRQDRHRSYREWEIKSEAKRKQQKNHICDYNGQESPWASKSEIDLQLICFAKGMPGLGFAPKAAQLKWLDTGKVEYSEFYICGLEQLCEDRAIPYPRKGKKQELINILEESDQWEGIEG